MILRTVDRARRGVTGHPLRRFFVRGSLLAWILLSGVTGCSSTRADREPAAPAGSSAGAGTITLCTQNLWNYGLPEEVKRHRRGNVPMSRLRDGLELQEERLLSRMRSCDVLAVQEIVGEQPRAASAALERLAGLLAEATGHEYAVRVAGGHDVIRNGFVYRIDGPWREVEFLPDPAGNRPLRVRGMPPAAWDRNPAELVLDLDASGATGTTGTTGDDGPLRLRVFSVHLKSKAEHGSRVDPDGEKWERKRIVQSTALLELANKRLERTPGHLLIVAGDFNTGRGSAAQAVLTGRLEPRDLIKPRDCIGPAGLIACDLPERAPVLVDLVSNDPDLANLGTYLHQGAEELLDGFVASPAAARLALEPGGSAEDYDVALRGRFRQGSDHLLVSVTLRY